VEIFAPSPIIANYINSDGVAPAPELGLAERSCTRSPRSYPSSCEDLDAAASETVEKAFFIEPKE
jgi:hypothetical protein